MGGVEDVVMVLLILGGGYYLWSTGELQKLLSGSGLPIPGITPTTPAPGLGPAAPSPGGGGGGGGGGGEAGGGGGGGGAPAPAGGGGGGGSASTGTGDCAKTIYQATGKTVDNSKRTKSGTRHYASGKPDDVTQEWGTKTSFKNYEFTCYITITKVDHDDQLSMKFGGTHMGSGWYDCGIGFNTGQGCLGKEENHPSTDLCVVKGKSIGKIVGKKIGMKCVYFGNSGGGGQVELWADPTANGNWQILCPRTNNIGGFAPSSASQECTIRIDAAPGIEMACSFIQEVTGPTRAGGGGAMPGVAPTQPVSPASGGGQSPQSGGGEKAEPKAEEPAAADDKKESKYSRVNRTMKSYRTTYY